MSTHAFLLLFVVAQTSSDRPVSLQIEPTPFSLIGRGDAAQLIVTATFEDGSVRDATRLVTWKVDNDEAIQLSNSGWVESKHNGTAKIVASLYGLLAEAVVDVRDSNKLIPTKFESDVLPALSKAGCNQGACHGTPTGKNGFRLSLRGYDPKLDFQSLTRDAQSSRANRIEPEKSQILLKGKGAIPHIGGQRFVESGIPYRIVRDWISEGLQPEPSDSATLTKLEVWPSSRVLDAPVVEQQLVVRATYSNEETRDVTRLARYSTSDEQLMKPEDDGLVRKVRRGEATILVSFRDRIATSRLIFLETVPSFEWTNPPTNNRVDELLFAKQKLMRIVPSGLCDDATFLRRLYLDVLGILPSPREVRDFVSNSRADKRSRVVDEVLARPEYVDFWTLKWADRLGCNQRFVGFKGAYSYHRWIRDQVARNVPFHDFAKSIITAKGSNYTNPPASFYRRIRSPEDAAESVSQLFLGVRLQCARCHNHVAERWTQDDYYGFAAYFSQLKFKDGPQAFAQYNKEETVYLNEIGKIVHPRKGQVMPPKALGASVEPPVNERDLREGLADWITEPHNPFFAKATVNRLWFHLLGRGIVDPVDDIRDSNPPASAELLDWLARDFVEHRYDVKHTLRLILNSRVYQLDSTTTPSNAEDSRYFSHANVRLLSAEQLLDAISSATAMPESLFHLPKGTRAAQIPDGEFNHPFLRGFGQPPRSVACECERASDSTLEQALQVVGGRTIHDKLSAPENRIGSLIQAGASPVAIVDELFLATLSRRPTDEERATLVTRFDDPESDRRRVAEDVLWTLINHPEFLFQH